MEPGGISSVIEPLIALILVGVGVAWYKQAAVGGNTRRGGRVHYRGAGGSSTGGQARSNSTSVSEWNEDQAERGRSPRYTRARVLQAVAQNPADHPYDELTLSTLHQHVMEQHFEVWNLLVERNVLPDRWRREHASDHGLVMR